MGCKCQCGNEYGFEPIGHWVCHKCKTMNDSGSLGGTKSDVLEPDRVDELVREATEFATHADASVRAHPDAWEAWYALGATYAARGNVLQAGYIWTKAAYMVSDEGVLERFVNRCISTMADCIVRVTIAGGRCNVPYAYGLEYVCSHRLGGRVSFCEELYGRIAEGQSKAVPRDAFALRNMASLVMLQRIELLPDIRDHIPLMRRIVEDADGYAASLPKTMNPLKKAIAKRSSEYTDELAAPYRLALVKAEEAVSSSDDDTLSKLAALQPDDGSAGFTDRLSKAVAKGAEISFKNASKSTRSEATELIQSMRDDVDAYVSMFMSGDATSIPESSVYKG